jgi:acetylglutamate kinase
MSFASERYRLAAEQASTVSRALPYLRRYAGATIVVKYGGHAMGDDSLAAGISRR